MADDTRAESLAKILEAWRETERATARAKRAVETATAAAVPAVAAKPPPHRFAVLLRGPSTESTHFLGRGVGRGLRLRLENPRDPLH